MNKIQVTKSSLPPIEEYINELNDIWDSHCLTNMGPKHEELRDKLKSFLNVKNIELFTNGHMALELAIQALGLKGEIITSPYTFASTTHAIVRNGCKPVFCDINEDVFTIDSKNIESLITENTVAIMPIHVYGNICDVENISKIAKKYNLKVIYDAAHSFGEKYNNIDVGNFGDISCFSFHATKVFNTIEGGCACYSDPEIGKKLYELKNFGIENAESITAVGSNAKMNEFCASMGLCNLKHINTWINKRKEVVNTYISLLRGIDGITLNNFQNNVEYNYSYFPIIINQDVYGHSRDEVYSELSKNNFIPRKYFYPITNTFKCYEDLLQTNETPIAHNISNKVLTLPLYPDLELSKVRQICDIIYDFKKV